MPCYDPRDDEEDALNIKRLHAATKAACDLAKAVRYYDAHHGTALWGMLSLTTQKWIREHEAMDEKRNNALSRSQAKRFKHQSGR